MVPRLRAELGRLSVDMRNMRADEVDWQIGRRKMRRTYGCTKEDKTGVMWYRVIGSIVFGLRPAWEAAWQVWMERLESECVNVQSDRAVEEYLGQRRDRGGLQRSNYAFEFLWITEWIATRAEECGSC